MNTNVRKSKRFTSLDHTSLDELQNYLDQSFDAFVSSERFASADDESRAMYVLHYRDIKAAVTDAKESRRRL